ncbi:DEAD/DEAH box helicase [Rhodopirellula sp. P2]|uniref:DEAD/DEAH box helicase n=1 Tax=Rhodopirellula sp. P2 TaxID=2127060 RepID=UPI0023681F80|nr:DEAD/DEAH box helicase [Rhodopirellula sp. P2]WDQ17975.1 DEAD/DEAH box helicase [Rhodopirellula sp. P2]
MIAIDFHGGTLRLRGWRDVGWSQASVAGRMGGIPLVFDDRDDCFRCDAMWAGKLQAHLREWDQEHFEIDSSSWWQWTAGPDPDWQPSLHDQRNIQLRPDQNQAVSDFESGGRCGLLVMPTGTGKTVVAMECILRSRCSVLVVVPVRDLMYQWHEKIREATGVDAGLIGDGVHRVSPISIATYDSAAIHMPRIGDRFKMLVFDEVHHLSGAWRGDAARMSTATIRMGLTATLPTDESRLQALHTLVGPTLHQQTIGQAKGKTLAEYRVHRIAVSLNESERNAYRGLSETVQEFVAEQRELDPTFRWEDIHKLSAAVDCEPERSLAAQNAMRAYRAKQKIEDQAEAKMRTLEDLFRLHNGQPVIVFTGTNVMARAVSMRFMVPCLLSHCAKKERREVLQRFAEGRYPVLVANRVLDEGVDLPEVKTAIVLGGLSSQRQAIQRLGRVLRRGSRKETAVLYEIVADGTNEVKRSRTRRRNDAYRKTS